MKAEKLEKLKQKLIANKSELSESTAEELIERATAYFLEYTNRSTVPDKAFWLIYDLCLALHKAHQELISEGRAVTSIKEGDTQVEYDKTEQLVLKRFRSSLNHYRVVIMR